MDERRRILLVTFPAQGQINPSLQFAKRLVKMGAEVTFVTSFSVLNRMSKGASTPTGLKFVGFSDGFDYCGWAQSDDNELFMTELRRRGWEAVAHLITSGADNGEPFAHVVYTILLPWVGRVARAHHMPSTFLSIQPAAMLDIYYYYFNGYGGALRNVADSDSPCSVELPRLPPLTSLDLSSFFQASNCYNFVLPLMKEHVEVILEAETNSKPKVFVNTFDALETEALRSVEKLTLFQIYVKAL